MNVGWFRYRAADDEDRAVAAGGASRAAASGRPAATASGTN